jgi:hypothetical protein
MNNLVKCVLCSFESPKDKMTHVHDMGKITYECWDEVNCKKRTQEKKNQLKNKNDVILKAQKEKEEKEKRLFMDEQNKKSIMERALERYDISMEDLLEYQETNNDGYVHYFDYTNHVVYSWNTNINQWSIGNPELTQKIKNDMMTE